MVNRRKFLIASGTAAVAPVFSAALGNPLKRPAGTPGFELQATPLFRGEGERLEQMVRVHVPGRLQAGAQLTLQGGGFNLTHKLDSLEKLRVGGLGFSQQFYLELTGAREALLFPVPEIRTPVQVTAHLQNGDATASGSFALEPQRKWEIYIVHHTHTDAGYTDIPERVQRRLTAELSDVLAVCRATQSFPPEARFHWVVEAFWVLENFWKEADQQSRAEFLDYVREGRIEVTASYLPHLSDIAGPESFFRFFTSSAEFAARHGFPLRSAMFSDSTGYPWITPQILNSMGVRYLSTAVNPTRALDPFSQLPRPIHWESPDGSRVLLWNADQHMAYPEGYQLRLAHSYEAAFPFLLAYLEGLTRSGYRFPELGLRAAQDNQGPALSLSQTIRDWNARWKYPRLKFSTNYHFLKTMEERHGKEIPTHRAAWPDWWSDLYVCDAPATGVLRLGHEWLSAAERLSALEGLLNQAEPAAASSLRVARQNILLSDEPLWGYAFAVDRPFDWRTAGATSDKVTDICNGAVNARAVATGSAQALFAKVVNHRTVVAFNPLGWARDGIAQFELPRGYAQEFPRLAGVRGLRDKASGKVLPLQKVHTDHLSTILNFHAQDVPALGYRVYEFADEALSASRGAEVEADRDTLENEYYRIRVDARKGTIASIFDKELKRELVDRAAPHGFNQYIYERPPGGDFKQVWGGMWWLDTIRNRGWLKTPRFERFVPGPAKLRPGMAGPVSNSLILESSAEMTPLVRQEIVLHAATKRVELVNTIRKQEIHAAEAAYFAFPFAMRNPRVRYEAAGTIVTPETGQLPLSARDWYGVQHWVKLADGEAEIVWTPLESPLVQFGGIHTDEWQKKLSVPNGSLYSFILCNYWMTDIKPSQGGEMIFRYSFTSQKPSEDDAAATRFGWNQLSPLIVAGPAGPSVPWMPAPKNDSAPAASTKPSESFCRISEPNILLLSFKTADDDRGHIVRLLEISGKATRARIEFGPLSISKAVAVDAVEQELAPGEGEDPALTAEGIEAAFRPFELKTFRIFFSS